jgi:hypothetical protein
MYAAYTRLETHLNHGQGTVKDMISVCGGHRARLLWKISIPHHFAKPYLVHCTLHGHSGVMRGG